MWRRIDMLSHSGVTVSVLVVALSVMILPQTALAHEQRTVGKVQMTVGWSTEPPYTGFRNTVQALLKDASGKPILDVGDGLKVQVIYGTQKTALLPLDPSFDPDTGLGTPGEYDAAIIPTRPGNYTFRFVGTVRGQRIDQSFTSSEKTFDPVTEATAVEFPVKDPSRAELAGRMERLGPRVEATQAAARNAGDVASQARTFAIVGILLGAVGVVVGITSRRKR